MQGRDVASGAFLATAEPGDNTVMRDDRRRFGGLLVMTTATLLAIVVAGFATFLAGALGFFVATGLLVAAYAATRRVARRRRS